MSPYLPSPCDSSFRPSLLSHLYLVIRLVNVLGSVYRSLRSLQLVLPKRVALPGTSPVSSSRDNRAALNSLMSSVLYARTCPSALSCSVALASRALLVVVDVRFCWFVVEVLSYDVGIIVDVDAAATVVGTGACTAVVGMTVALGKLYRHAGISVYTAGCSIGLHM